MPKLDDVVQLVPPPEYEHDDWPLYEADPECKHETEEQPRGGVKCIHCNGWFCF